MQSLYHEGIVFNQLEHLKICSCDSDWSILLARLLKDSPNLRELETYMIYVSFFFRDLLSWFCFTVMTKPNSHV